VASAVGREAAHEPDGTFWMTLADWAMAFSSVTICCTDAAFDRARAGKGSFVTEGRGKHAGQYRYQWLGRPSTRSSGLEREASMSVKVERSREVKPKVDIVNSMGEFLGNLVIGVNGTIHAVTEGLGGTYHDVSEGVGQALHEMSTRASDVSKSFSRRPTASEAQMSSEQQPTRGASTPSQRPKSKGNSSACNII